MAKKIKEAFKLNLEKESIHAEVASSPLRGSAVGGKRSYNMRISPVKDKKKKGITDESSSSVKRMKRFDSAFEDKDEEDEAEEEYDAEEDEDDADEIKEVMKRSVRGGSSSARVDPKQKHK